MLVAKELLAMTHHQTGRIIVPMDTHYKQKGNFQINTFGVGTFLNRNRRNVESKMVEAVGVEPTSGILTT